MPHKLVHDTTGQTDLPHDPQAAGGNGESDLAPETRDSIIAQAKEIIAGRFRPPSLVTPPAVEAFLEREFKDFEPPPTPEAIRRAADRLNLQAHYSGRPVACVLTADGALAVLGSGEREVRALLGGLTEEEGAKVVVECPDQF